jgi:magnesium transporter
MEVLTELERDRILELRRRDEFFWLDLVSPSDADLDAAAALLGLHELAVEDTREFGQRPKLDRYPEHVLLVYWSARVGGVPPGVEPVELHLHIAGGFLLTVHRGPSPELDESRAALAVNRGDDEIYVIYRVLDGLTDALFPVVDHLEARIDTLEEAVLDETDRHQLSDIYRLKQQVQLVQRRLVPQRDQFPGATVAITALPGMTHGKREYLHDVGDHLAQVSSELSRQADDLAALTGTYFNANQNRLSKLATRLTVLATFFLVWTLVTSFFGQNFRWLVNHVSSFGAFAIYETLGLVLPTVLAAIYFWRRRREWL